MNKDLCDIVNKAGRGTAYADDPDGLFLRQLRQQGYDIIPDDPVKYPNSPDSPLYAPIPLRDGAYPHPGLIVPIESKGGN